MKTLATIRHNDNSRTDRVEIAYDAEQGILVAREQGGDWVDAVFGTMKEDEALDRIAHAWSGDEWDLELVE